MEFCIGTMGLLVTLLMLGIILEELMGIMLLGAILPGCMLSFRLLLPLAAIPYTTAQSPLRESVTFKSWPQQVPMPYTPNSGLSR